MNFAYFFRVNLLYFNTFLKQSLQRFYKTVLLFELLLKCVHILVLTNGNLTHVANLAFVITFRFLTRNQRLTWHFSHSKNNRWKKTVFVCLSWFTQQVTLFRSLFISLRCKSVFCWFFVFSFFVLKKTNVQSSRYYGWSNQWCSYGHEKR